MTVGELKGILSMYPDKMPVPTGFAEIVSDNLPVLHTVDSVLFCDLHSNDKSDTKSARAKIIATSI